MSAATRSQTQRVWADAEPGQSIGAVEFPLTMYRMVVAAGGNRDFNSIHHNRDYARASGAPDSYAMTFFLMGTWERLVRDWIGAAGTIRSISDFRMRRFNLVGSTMVVSGTVVEKNDDGSLVLEVVSRVGDEVTVGPGRVTVTLPRDAS